jgi:hypothetical protein
MQVCVWQTSLSPLKGILAVYDFEVRDDYRGERNNPGGGEGRAAGGEMLIHGTLY